MNWTQTVLNKTLMAGGAILVVVSYCVSGSSGSEIQTPPTHSSGVGSTDVLSPVSADFVQQIEKAKNSIPDGIWRALWQAGWRLQLAEFVVDASPELKQSRPRNWPPGATWENTDALHLPKSRRVVIAEKRKDRSGTVIANTRVGGALRHEVGHAFDMATGGGDAFSSATPRFIAAYQQDIARVAQNDQLILSYYLADSAAGRQESFAEAFAIVLGGGSDQAHRDLVINSFPTVTQFVSELIERFESQPVDPSSE